MKIIQKLNHEIVCFMQLAAWENLERKEEVRPQEQLKKKTVLIFSLSSKTANFLGE